MSDGIGLGLLLNILFWTVAVLVAVGLGSLAVIEYFPGREHKTRPGGRGSRPGAPDVPARDKGDAASGRYRDAA